MNSNTVLEAAGLSGPAEMKPAVVTNAADLNAAIYQHIRSQGMPQGMSMPPALPGPQSAMVSMHIDSEVVINMTLAGALQLPVVTANASHFEESTYGAAVVKALYQKADGNLSRAQQGIVIVRNAQELLKKPASPGRSQLEFFLQGQPYVFNHPDAKLVVFDGRGLLTLIAVDSTEVPLPSELVRRLGLHPSKSSPFHLPVEFPIEMPRIDIPIRRIDAPAGPRGPQRGGAKPKSKAAAVLGNMFGWVRK